MLIKSVLFSIITIYILSFANAQTPIGYFYDADYNPVEGYLDELAYSPKNALKLTHNSDSFEKGSYYTLSGEKIDGLIKFENKKFWYKADKVSSKDKIRPAEVQSILVGIDSFFITTNFRIETGSVTPSSLRTKPEPVQYITTVGNHIFVKHYNFVSRMGQSFGSGPINETFMVKDATSDKWVSFPKTTTAFKKVATDYFGHIPHLKALIKEKELDHTDMMTLIKTAEYLTKFENKESLAFDAYWQETTDDSRTKYTAEITNVEDSIWTMDYFQDKNKLATAQYSSFYPHRKNGTFKWYHANGSQRKSVVYKNDKPKEVKLFTENGMLTQHYKFVKNELKDVNELVYLVYQNEQGNSLLDDQGNGTVTIQDKVFERQLVREIKNFKIDAAYFMDGSERVYQLSDSRFKFKIKSFKKRFSDRTSSANLEKAAAENAQGVMLVYLKIAPKGNVVKYKVLNEIHPQMDKIVSNFLKNNLTAVSYYPHKFKAVKVNKEKVAYEVVIPISLSINRFYRQVYTPYYDPFWHMQHQQMQHQMMMDHIQSIAPPPMPSFR